MVKYPADIDETIPDEKAYDLISFIENWKKILTEEGMDIHEALINYYCDQFPTVEEGIDDLEKKENIVKECLNNLELEPKKKVLVVFGIFMESIVKEFYQKITENEFKEFLNKYWYSTEFYNKDDEEEGT